MAHHVTQRGHRRQPVFFGDEDLSRLPRPAGGRLRGGRRDCLAHCLMPDHVHRVMVPASADALRAALGEAHRRYTRRVDVREGWRD